MAEEKQPKIEWSCVPGTSNWILVDDTGQMLRQVAVRKPSLNEPGAGTKFEVSGRGHHSIYDSLAEAQEAAVASLGNDA